jgi:carbonic anhydrase/acetyltransferase-like protein (isoleucine patch superfamily)
MSIRKYRDNTPQYTPSCYIDEVATVIGQVTLLEDVSIWPNAILRGDVNYIQIGQRTNIQDGSILHVCRPTIENPKGYPLILGEDITVGHNVCLHGCKIHNRVLIGIGAILLDGSIIESDIIIGAGTLVPPNKRLKSGYLYLGQPAKAIRPLNEKEKNFFIESAQNYVQLKNEYIKGV